MEEPVQRFGTVPILTRSEAPGPKFRGPAAFKGQLYLDSSTGTFFRARDEGRDALWDRVYIQTRDELRDFILSVSGGEGGGSTILVDGEPVDSYSISSTPLTAADIDAYTQDEVDDIISGLNLSAADSYSGISMWDEGNIESVTRAPGFADKSLGSGVLWLQHFYAPRTSKPIVSLGYSHRTPGASGASARLALFGIELNGDAVKLAETAAFAPSGTYADQVRSFSTADGFPANYVLEKGLRYAIGVLSIGTTPGAAHGWDIPGSGNKPVISRRVSGITQVGGVTTIANNYSNAAMTDWYEGLYLFGRHASG